MGKRIEIPQMAVNPEVCVQLATACSSAALQDASLSGIVDVNKSLEKGSIDMQTWAEVLAWGISSSASTTAHAHIAEILTCLFFLRAASHIALVQPMTDEDAELEVMAQRDLIFEVCRLSDQ